MVDDKKYLSICGKNYLDKYTNNILGSIFYNKKLYSQGFYSSLYSDKHYIDLDEKYKRLTGFFGIDDSSSSNKCEFRLERIADEYSIFDKTVKNAEKPINVDVKLETFQSDIILYRESIRILRIWLLWRFGRKKQWIKADLMRCFPSYVLLL